MELVFNVFFIHIYSIIYQKIVLCNAYMCISVAHIES